MWKDEEGTQKILFALADGAYIESVLIKHPDHNTLCISSQVGCRFNCAFCATGKMGFQRNLSPGEIVAQVLEGEEIAETPVRNVVFMNGRAAG